MSVNDKDFEKVVSISHQYLINKSAENLANNPDLFKLDYSKVISNSSFNNLSQLRLTDSEFYKTY